MWFRCSRWRASCKARGHECVFIGTRTGFEAKLVPAAGFPLEFIEIGGLNRVGIVAHYPDSGAASLSVVRVLRLLRQASRPSAIFSLGGYAAGPVVLARLAGSALPLVVMEPNAMPGLTNRQIGRFVTPRAAELSRRVAILSAGQVGDYGLAGALGIFRHSAPRRATRSSPF